MILGIVSDTHGQVQHTRAAIRMLESCQVKVVIHCGDIGSIDVVNMFGSWPTHFVFGNVDVHEGALRKAIEDAGHTCHGRFGTLELEGRRIAFLHGDDARLFEATVGDGRYDLVCYGHTHIAKQQRHGNTLLLNPGALYRANPHSLATVELPEMEVAHISL